jgi:hypothetical protein
VATLSTRGAPVWRKRQFERDETTGRLVEVTGQQAAGVSDETIAALLLSNRFQS